MKGDGIKKQFRQERSYFFFDVPALNNRARCADGALAALGRVMFAPL